MAAVVGGAAVAAAEGEATGAGVAAIGFGAAIDTLVFSAPLLRLNALHLTTPPR